MMRFRPEHIARSLENLYEAAANPELWRRSLHDFSQAFGADGVIMHLSGESRTPWAVNSEGLDESIPKYFRDGWHLQNEPLRRSNLAFRRGEQIVTEGTLFTPEEWTRDPMVADFLRPHGLGWFAGMKVVASPEMDISLSLNRGFKNEPFSRREVEHLVRALPHIRRASQFAAARSTAHADGVLDGFSLLHLPAMLLDQRGLVYRINEGARSLLGGGLDVVAGRLTAAHPSTNAALTRLIGTLVTTGAVEGQNALGPVPVPRPVGHPLVVHGAPIVRSARDLFRAAVAVVTIVDPDEGRDMAELLLQSAFGLTRAEAQTAAFLAAGLDLAQIAIERRVGLETVKSHVKALAIKTATHSRSEQVMLFNRVLLGAFSRHR